MLAQCLLKAKLHVQMSVRLTPVVPPSSREHQVNVRIHLWHEDVDQAVDQLSSLQQKLHLYCRLAHCGYNAIAVALLTICLLLNSTAPLMTEKMPSTGLVVKKAG